jgi:hypothetical protein
MAASTGIKMYEGGDKIFLKACAEAKVQPTRRQYRKWCRGEGKAYTNRDNQPVSA